MNSAASDSLVEQARQAGDLARTIRTEAPTDAQLSFIASLCEQRGLIAPQVVASKQEASQIITAIRAGRYCASDYEWPWEVPFR